MRRRRHALGGIALAVPLFLVAFLFFGSLMLGTGSLGSNMREAQQLAMVWSLIAALPLMHASRSLIREPHGIVARVMTWMPFTAGPLIMFRASMDPARSRGGRSPARSSSCSSPPGSRSASAPACSASACSARRGRSYRRFSGRRDSTNLFRLCGCAVVRLCGVRRRRREPSPEPRTRAPSEMSEKEAL